MGGNGGGKTTLTKMICGLYPLSSGRLELDGQLIEGATIDKLRSNISAVFADMYLFEDLDHRGLQDAQMLAHKGAEANQVLSHLAMAPKVSVADGGFSTLDLSTGQRKRLALAAAIAGERSIMIFDEWAADQDPEFREYSYLQLLPELRQRGATVIAITHDDRYFDVADQLIKLEQGQIVERRRHEPHMMRPPYRITGTPASSQAAGLELALIGCRRFVDRGGVYFSSSQGSAENRRPSAC